MQGWKITISKQRICPGGQLQLILTIDLPVWYFHCHLMPKELRSPDSWWLPWEPYFLTLGSLCCWDLAEARFSLSSHIQTASLDPASFSCLSMKDSISLATHQVKATHCSISLRGESGIGDPSRITAFLDHYYSTLTEKYTPPSTLPLAFQDPVNYLPPSQTHQRRL